MSNLKNLLLIAWKLKLENNWKLQLENHKFKLHSQQSAKLLLIAWKLQFENHKIKLNSQQSAK